MNSQSCQISAGICAHNEEETIGKLLDQLLEENIEFSEIIVVVAGDDSTASEVRDRQKRSDSIKLVEETTREGQTSAQNKIFDRFTGDLLLFVDGDGVIKPGSIEKMISRYEDGKIVQGREIPRTQDTFLGSVIETLWDFHDYVCRKEPKFSTQLGLIPAELVARIPKDIVLDDEFILNRALEKGYKPEYFPGAIKYHHTPTDLRFYFNQRRKNWAGKFQLENRRRNYLGKRIGFLLEYFKNVELRKKFLITAVSILELLALLIALMDHLRSDHPFIWYRN